MNTKITHILASRKNTVYILLLSLFGIILFRRLFSIYFFQDDFFVLFLSQIHDIKSFFSFFLPHTDVQFYRPLSHEIFYFLAFRLFGLNAIFYHLAVIAVWNGLLLLIFMLTKYYFDSLRVRFLFIFLFATSAIHYNSLYWIVNFSYILVAFFYFLNYLIYKIYLNTSLKAFLLSLFFILGLLSNEFMITFPVMIAVDSLIFKNMRANLKYLILLASILGLYMTLRFVLYTPVYDTYQFEFDKSIISSYRWFILFFLGWAETMKDQMITFYQVRKFFWDSFYYTWYVYIGEFLLFFTCLIVLPVYFICKKRRIRVQFLNKLPIFIFGLLWFLITLLPIIFVPSHISPHQGTIALFGFLLICLSLIDLLGKYNLRLFITISLAMGMMWVATTTLTVVLNDQVHWIFNRSNLSKEWIEKTKIAFPSLTKGDAILINTDNKEAIVALNGGRGIQVLYSDYTLRVYFSSFPNIPAFVRVVP